MNFRVLILTILFLSVGCAVTNKNIDCTDEQDMKKHWDIATKQSYEIAIQEMPEEFAKWVYQHVPPWDEWMLDEFHQPPPYYLYWENEAHDSHPDNFDEYYDSAHDSWIRTVEIRKEVMKDYPCNFGAWNGSNT